MANFISSIATSAASAAGKFAYEVVGLSGAASVAVYNAVYVTVQVGVQIGVSVALNAAFAPSIPNPAASQNNIKQPRPVRRYGVGTPAIGKAMTL